MAPIRTRVAPSPTGSPHIGTVFQGLLDYVYAKKYGGKFVVRIEDTDRNRYVEDAEEKIFAAFEWAGITPDEGPDIGGEFGPYRQSERLELYQKYARQLIEQGDAYYCFCSPERLTHVRSAKQKSGKPPMYDKHCRDMNPIEGVARAENEPHVVRMKVPTNKTIVFQDVIRGEISFDSNTVDDQVILKSDGYPTYHLAVVVDDHLMEISHMVRGEEWISSTPKHVLLYRYLGWEMPKVIHTPLLRNPNKSKLGKRHGHASVDWYIEQGYLRDAVINFLATRVWNHPQGLELFGINEMIKHFEFADMHIQGPIVDLDKLNWLNGQWIRKISDDELIEEIEPYRPKGLSRELLKSVLPYIKERLVMLSEIEELTRYFYEPPRLRVKELIKQSKMDNKDTAGYLKQVIDALIASDDWQAEEMEKKCRELQQNLEMKPRPAFMTIRVALTGRTATPPLFDVMEILGKDETIRRLESAIDVLYTHHTQDRMPTQNSSR